MKPPKCYRCDAPGIYASCQYELKFKRDGGYTTKKFRIKVCKIHAIENEHGLWAWICQDHDCVQQQIDETPGVTKPIDVVLWQACEIPLSGGQRPVCQRCKKPTKAFHRKDFE